MMTRPFVQAESLIPMLSIQKHSLMIVFDLYSNLVQKKCSLIPLPDHRILTYPITHRYHSIDNNNR